MDIFKVYQIYFLTLILLGFFGLKILNFATSDYVYLAIVLAMASLAFLVKKPYAQMIRLYVMFVLTSCIYSTLFNHQDFIQVFGHSYDYFALLFFFALLQINLSSKETLKVMEMLGLTFCICYIIQWLIYPTVIFSLVEFFADTSKYRARMTGSICCYFMLLYSINQYLLKRKTKYLLYGILGFIPIIIQGFRTLVSLSVVSAFLLIPFVLRSGKKTIMYSLLGAGLSVAILSTNLVQSKIDEMTQRQENEQTFENEDYIRWLSFDYYWNIQFNKPLEKLTGGGKPVDKSSKYTKAINIARNNYNLYWTDLGIVGLSMIIGIPAVLLLVVMYIRCIWRCKEPQMQFVRFTLFVVLIGSIFTTAELYREGNILLLSLFLYFEFKYHQENKSNKSYNIIAIKRLLQKKGLLKR